MAGLSIVFELATYKNASSRFWRWLDSATKSGEEWEEVKMAGA
jgi:hypothetical protein